MSQTDQSSLKYMNMQINSTHCTYFLGVSLNSTLPWQRHVNKVITKLNSAYFAIRSLKLFLTIENLRIVYFAYVHSIIMYGLPFWGNTVNSKNVFMVQKKIIRIIMNVNPKICCRGLFRCLNTLLALLFAIYVFLIVVGSKKCIQICN
jgi:hypothetical protein